MAVSVAAIVVNWNGFEDTKGCVESLLACLYAPLHIIVVDNGSDGDEAGQLQAAFPGIDLVRLPENLGYAAACNAGMFHAQRAGADYLCILNNDTTLAPDFFDHLVRESQDSGEAAVLAPMILQPDGTIWSAGGVLRWPNLAGEHIGLGEAPEQHALPMKVDWASGCALFLASNVFDRLGPMDEELFLYLDDIDWCLEAASKGIDIIYVPEARISHGVNKTVRAMDQKLPRYYAYRNFYRVGFRHANLRWRVWLGGHLAFTLAKCAVRNLISARTRADDVYNARTRGLWDFVRGRFGKAPYAHEIAGRTDREQVRA